MKIVLPCKTTDDLNWDPILGAIKEGPIQWEFELGLNAPYFPLENELTFNALKLALSHFTERVWPLLSEKTTSAILYRGSLDFATHFLWTEKQEDTFHHWKKERPLAGEGHNLRLFAADAFAHYFQMLAHALPDELPLTLDFDPRGCGSKAETKQLLSKERFEHFQVLPEEIKASQALCMPQESLCSGSILAKLDALLLSLQQPCQLLEEAFLTETWEGVDRLYVLSEAVTSQGRRKLMGFCAAGGQVIVEGEPLGLPNEVRGRGI